MYEGKVGHRPVIRPALGGGRVVQSERSESRSDAGGALDDGITARTFEMRGDALLTTEEVAAWLRVSPSTLCRWRKTGCGPRTLWLSTGVPRYRRADVDSWLLEAAA